MITAPYNFVPLSEKVFYPNWAEQVSHDVPFEDGEDGLIKLTIKNVSPLFVRNGGKRDAKEEYSSHIMNDGSRHYFIPGSTLKGCFRSVMEILSFGKMEQYDKDSFGLQREFGKGAGAIAYKNATKGKVFCGWLQKGDHGYTIFPCAKGVQRIRKDEIKSRFPSYNHDKDQPTADIKQKSLGTTDLYPMIYAERDSVFYLVGKDKHYVPEGYYRLVCTGFFDSKVQEYLFSEEQNAPLDVPEEIFRQFDSVHKNTKCYNGEHGKGGFLRNRLQQGNKIPVFFMMKDGKVSSMGITMKYRVPFISSIEDAVNNTGIKNEAYPDMAQTIFGYTNGRETLKGRVQFGHAFCKRYINDNQLKRITGVLGQPSASFYPLYLRRSNGKADTYASPNVQIAGRKRYRIAEGNKTLEIPRNEENPKVNSTFHALPVGEEFISSISVHNLRPAETGALLAAITLCGTPDTYHNIGLAKSFGFGKVQCQIELVGFKNTVDEYQRAFEISLIDSGINIFESESYRALMAICSEHAESQMAMMDLVGYKNAKSDQNEYPVALNERKASRFVISIEEYNAYRSQRDKRIAEEKALAEKKAAEEKALAEKKAAEEKALAERQAALEQKRSIVRQKLASADNYMQLGSWHDALRPIADAEAIAHEIGELEQEVAEKKALCEAQIAAKNSKPLAETLAGQSKLGTIAGKTEKWAKNNSFTEAEVDVLANLINSLPPKEIKSFAKNRGKFVKAIGEEWTAKLAEKINV